MDRTDKRLSCFFFQFSRHHAIFGVVAAVSELWGRCGRHPPPPAAPQYLLSPVYRDSIYLLSSDSSHLDGHLDGFKWTNPMRISYPNTLLLSVVPPVARQAAQLTGYQDTWLRLPASWAVGWTPEGGLTTLFNCPQLCPAAFCPHLNFCSTLRGTSSWDDVGWSMFQDDPLLISRELAAAKLWRSARQNNNESQWVALKPFINCWTLSVGLKEGCFESCVGVRKCYLAKTMTLILQQRILD